MKKAMLLCIIALIMGCVGCVTPRVLQPYTYTELIQPITVEGKKCAVECQKIQLLEKELINIDYAIKKEQSDAENAAICGQYRGRDAARLRADCMASSSGPLDLRDLDFMSIDFRYNSCVVDCGGRNETRSGMR